MKVIEIKNTRKSIKWAGILSFMLISIACSTSNSQTTSEVLKPKEFAEKLAKSSDAVLLDVRTPGEYEGGHIENSLNVDWNGDHFDTQIADIDKDAPVYVYCLSGGRSGKAVSHLKDKGYTNVVELDGGMMAWRKAALPETKEASTVAKEKELTNEDFTKLIDSDDYVLIDFHAEWCGPCKKLKPILDEVGKEYAEQITIVRIDVDKNPTISNQMNVTGIPDMRLYKNRKLVWETKGLVEKSVIVEQLK